MKTPLSTLLGRLYLIAVYTFVLAPMAVIVLMAFNSATSFPSGFEGLTFRWFAALADQPVFGAATLKSLYIGLLAAAISTLIAFCAGYALYRWRWRAEGGITMMLSLPLLVPQIVMSLAMLQFGEALGVGTTRTGLIAVHAVYVLPFALRLVMGGFAQFNPALEEAAISLGASRLRVWYEVTLPQLRPNLVAAFCFCFMLSFVNLPLSMFLTNPETATLPTVMFAYIESRIDPMMAALATLIIAVAIATTVILDRWLKVRLVA